MRVVTTLLAGVLLLTGCAEAQDAVRGGVDDLRSRADDLLAQGQELRDTFVWCSGAVQLARAVVSGDVAAAQAAADDLLQTAPEEVQPDLRTVAAAAERAEQNDASVLMDESVQQAARDVYAYAVDRCGLPEDA